MKGVADFKASPLHHFWSFLFLFGAAGSCRWSVLGVSASAVDGNQAYLRYLELGGGERLERWLKSPSSRNRNLKGISRAAQGPWTSGAQFCILGLGMGKNKALTGTSLFPAYLFLWTLFKKEEVEKVRVSIGAIRWECLELHTSQKMKRGDPA